MKKIILQISFVTFLFLGINNGYSQSIYKSWFSEDANVCLKINETGFSSLCDLDNVIFKYNPKKKELKLCHIWSYPQKNGKDTYLYTVEKLTNDTLIIIENSKKRTFNYMGNLGRLVFIASDMGCDNLWIRHNIYLRPSNQSK